MRTGEKPDFVLRSGRQRVAAEALKADCRQATQARPFWQASHRAKSSRLQPQILSDRRDRLRRRSMPFSGDWPKSHMIGSDLVKVSNCLFFEYPVPQLLANVQHVPVVLVGCRPSPIVIIETPNTDWVPIVPAYLPKSSKFRFSCVAHRKMVPHPKPTIHLFSLEADSRKTTQLWPFRAGTSKHLAESNCDCAPERVQQIGLIPDRRQAVAITNPLLRIQQIGHRHR